jgi:hypothetical protein
VVQANKGASSSTPSTWCSHIIRCEGITDWRRQRSGCN